ncbi:hypothetical protein R1flu_013857 [Riccia fluitans]|uniref:Transmembrane protein n=1 Tax=Riccia fluitans TaxID=41844 RepID=A0ABD1YEG4_9MARC
MALNSPLCQKICVAVLIVMFFASYALEPAKGGSTETSVSTITVGMVDVKVSQSFPGEIGSVKTVARRGTGKRNSGARVSASAGTVWAAATAFIIGTMIPFLS